MATVEKLHQLIHSNLKLLRDSGCKIDCEEGMFRNPNLPMFEKVGYALLMIVDPAECTKKIPWPLLENKSLRSEFRNKFVSFIKMINSKYPQAKIPEIPASRLHFPEGVNFLQFMLKLSTFAVWIEMTRISSPQEIEEELLPRFQPSKDAKDNIVKLNIVKGAIHTENLRLQELIDYQTSALPVIQKLKTQNEKVCHEIALKSEQMKKEISNLKVDDLIKERLMNVEDNDIMTDWNTSVEQKIAQVRHQKERLDRLRNLAAECWRTAQAVESSQDLCLDGAQLAVSPALAEMAGCPVYNSKGEVVLAAVLEAGQVLAAQLAQRTPSLPPLPEAQELLQEYRKLLVQSDSLRSAVESSCTESQRAISKLQPVVYAHMKEKPVPEHFQYLRARPTIQFVQVGSPSKHVSPAKKERANRWSEIVKRKKSCCKSRVVCSVKRRRSSKWAFLETPDMKAFRHPGLHSNIKRSNRPMSHLGTLPHLLPPTTQPRLRTHLATLPRHPEVTVTSTSEKVTCRKSLYGELPTGAKTEVEEDILPLLGVSNLPPDSAQPKPKSSAQPTPGTSAQPTPGTSAQPKPKSSAQPKPKSSAQPTPGTSAQPTPGTSAQPTPKSSAQPKPKSSNRKSISDIVERYKKLKKVMDANK